MDPTLWNLYPTILSEWEMKSHLLAKCKTTQTTRWVEQNIWLIGWRYSISILDHIVCYLLMKHTWDESAWDDTCEYLAFKLLLSIFQKFSWKELDLLLLQNISLLKMIILALKRAWCILNASNKAKFSVIRTKIPF